MSLCTVLSTSEGDFSTLAMASTPMPGRMVNFLFRFSLVPIFQISFLSIRTIRIMLGCAWGSIRWAHREEETHILDWVVPLSCCHDVRRIAGGRGNGSSKESQAEKEYTENPTTKHFQIKSSSLPQRGSSKNSILYFVSLSNETA